MATLTPLLVNGFATTLASSVANGTATSFSLTSATGLPTIGTGQYIPAVVVDTSASPETIVEYVWITAVSGTTATVMRATEDASRFPAAAIASGLTVAAVATSTSLNQMLAHGAGGEYPRDRGFLAWSDEPVLAANQGSFALQKLVLSKIWVPVTMPVTNLTILSVSAGVGLTSGQNFAGIYDSTGAKLAGTADQTSAWGSSGTKTMALSGGPVTITGGPDVFVWGAVLSNGTTAPTVCNRNIASTTDFAVVGLTVSTARAATNGSSLTALPSSLTPSSNAFASTEIWMALS